MKADGFPGKFKLLVNGKTLGPTFGTEGARWHWQDGGVVNLNVEPKPDRIDFQYDDDGNLVAAEPVYDGQGGEEAEE